MPVATGVGWTEPRVEALKALWAQGYSASQVAQRLGGCTRNAVIGKVHRIGLAKRRPTTSCVTYKSRRPRDRASPVRPKAARQPRPKKDLGFGASPLPDAEVKAFTLAVHPEDAAINRRPLAELDIADCRWPIGDPHHDDFGFCGASALRGRPYCERHSARAWAR